jgi:hypothetical protein
VGGIWITSPEAPAEGPRAAATAPGPQAAPPPTVDPNSGFDITTEPPGGKVRLDGNEIGTAPLRVRSLLSGKHKLEVSGIAGYRPSTQEIVVEQGQALTLAVRLEQEGAPPLAKLLLTSEPAGAQVTLTLDGHKTALGATPIEARLEQGKRYQALFELDGHAPVTREVSSTDGAIAVTLSKAAAAATPPPKQITAPAPARSSDRRRDSAAERRRRDRERAAEERAAARERAQQRALDRAEAERNRPPRETTAPAPIVVTTPSSPKETTSSGPRTVEVGSGAPGMLTIGAKPPCTVFIDGKDTGRVTPIRDLEVKSGAVKVTLVNGEFGIRESFSVSVKPGETAKVIKDFSDRLPK